jgi:dienelactone hydrolase
MVSSRSSSSVFDYPRAEIPFQNEVLDEEETKNYLVRHIEFPSVGYNRQRNNQVVGRYYESKLPGKKPLIIVIPIFGGHNYPPRNMTLYLKRASEGGVNVFHMEAERKMTDWWALKHADTEEAFMKLWEATAEAERNTVVDIRRIIDWAETRSEIDPSRVGIIGFSRGAVSSAVVTTQDSRLAATVLVMGGAYPHLALATCPMLRGVGVHEKVQKEYGWTLEDYADRLEPLYVDLDPATYPGQTDPGRILIVEAAKDECMSADSRQALWLAMGQPERILIPKGHKQAFLSMTPLGGKWLQKDIWRFLQEKL